MPAKRIFIVIEKLALAAFLKDLWLVAICNSSSRRFDVLLWPQQTCTYTEIKTVRISLYEGISCLRAIQIDLGAPCFHSPALSALSKPAEMHGRVPKQQRSLCLRVNTAGTKKLCWKYRPSHDFLIEWEEDYSCENFNFIGLWQPWVKTCSLHPTDLSRMRMETQALRPANYSTVLTPWEALKVSYYLLTVMII